MASQLVLLSLLALANANLSEGRAQLSAASAQDIVVFAGGYDSSGDANVADIFNATSKTWGAPYKGFEGRGDMCSVGVEDLGGLIFFAGGKHSHSYRTNTVDIYHVSTNTW